MKSIQFARSFIPHFAGDDVGAEAAEKIAKQIIGHDVKVGFFTKVGKVTNARVRRGPQNKFCIELEIEPINVAKNQRSAQFGGFRVLDK